MLLFGNTSGHVVFHNSKHYLEISFAEEIETESFLLLINACIEAFSGLKKQYPLIQLLFDAQRVKKIDGDVLKNTGGNAMTLLFHENGVRYIAFIPPKDKLEGVSEFVEIANGLHFLSQFNEEESASKWLINQCHLLKHLVTQTQHNFASN